MRVVPSYHCSGAAGIDATTKTMIIPVGIIPTADDKRRRTGLSFKITVRAARPAASTRECSSSELFAGYPFFPERYSGRFLFDSEKTSETTSKNQTRGAVNADAPSSSLTQLQKRRRVEEVTPWLPDAVRSGAETTTRKR